MIRKAEPAMISSSTANKGSKLERYEMVLFITESRPFQDAQILQRLDAKRLLRNLKSTSNAAADLSGGVNAAGARLRQAAGYTGTVTNGKHIRDFCLQLTGQL